MNIKQNLLVLLLLVFSIATIGRVSAQINQKQNLTPAAFSRWGSLSSGKVSPNEKWVSYRMYYQNVGGKGTDSLFVRNIVSHKTYSFTSAYGDGSAFTSDNAFILRVNGNLQIIDLANDKVEIVQEVQQQVYLAKLNLLVLFVKTDEGKYKLIVRSPLGKQIAAFSDVTSFSCSPNEKWLAYNTKKNGKNAVYLAEFSKLTNPKQLVEDTAVYDNFSWHKDEKALAFFKKSTAKVIQSLAFYNLENNKLFEFDPFKETNFPLGWEVYVDGSNQINISDDLQNVLFSIKKQKNVQPVTGKSKVEIWNFSDSWVYPQAQRNGSAEDWAKVIAWQPLKKSFIPITTNELSRLQVTTDLDYAILSNPKAYEPQFEFHGPRDYYLLNLKTFERDLLLEKHKKIEGAEIFTSPKGKYVAYFRDGNWWIYDVTLKSHTNITESIGASFFGLVGDQTDGAFGSPGWSTMGNEILLYDEFDIWVVKSDGTNARRITNGREQGIKYRLDLKNDYEGRPLYDGSIVKQYDLQQTILLYGEGKDGKTGYFRWNAGKGTVPIIYKDSYFKSLLFDSKKEKFITIEERFDLPPRLINIKGSAEQKTIFQSNPHHDKFNWGRSELIHFQNSKKQNLKGVLFYPANYDSSKKYPMVVNIYGTRSYMLHRYVNPSIENQAGFNHTLLTLNDYFVFMPDILHEDENVGPSTLDCVVAGTKRVIDMGLVDPKKIALTGHSFGGYGTAFVINHTNLFATAIASGAITDLTRRYWTVGINTAMPEMWRFSKGKGWRMGDKTPISHRVDFDRNSPLGSVENLNIPLLMWTGKEDTQVDPYQSTSYYMALRRLGKKGVFLQYPKEGHTLYLDPVNQKDITERVLQWLGYYLKGEQPVEWITKTN